jgi:hypothetical protein
MAQVFISYARADGQALAARLQADLQSAGISVWLDQRQIELGGSFTEDIERAIDTCEVMLALLSSGSQASKWCRMEQLRALRKGKKLIPIRVQANAEPPLHLEHLNAIDFSDNARYNDNLRDLLSDMAASRAFIVEAPPSDVSAGRTSTERRSAAAFRRAVRALRRESWGLRQWWTYFLFHAVALHDLPDLLQSGMLVSPRRRSPSARSQWDRYVRLSFRPRTPSFFDREGYYPASSAPANCLHAPAWLMFDLESMLLHPQARFSDGDPSAGAGTYATPRAFAELPFEQIYHDSWIRHDMKEEILRHREAQVLLPEAITLEALQMIWLRSEADYETLAHLLPAPLWAKWRDKVTARTDFMLFNHKHLYITHARLSAERIELHFNPARLHDERFTLRLIVTYAHGEEREWSQAEFVGDAPLVLGVRGTEGYGVRVLLDEQLAYLGSYRGAVEVF